jgi:hypothetical protein
MSRGQPYTPAETDALYGIPVMLDLAPGGNFSCDQILTLNPPLENIERLDLTGFYIQNSNTKVIRIAIDSDAFSTKKMCHGIQTRDNVTDTFTPHPTVVDSPTTDNTIAAPTLKVQRPSDQNYPLTQALGNSYQTLSNQTVGFSTSAVVVFVPDSVYWNTVTEEVGVTNAAAQYIQFNIPKPISHDFRNRVVSQLHVTVSSLYGGRITADNMKLELRAYPKWPQYDRRQTGSVYNMATQYG